MPYAPTLVAGLGPGVGTVLDDVANLVTVITGRLVTILGAVPGNMSGSKAPVASVLIILAIFGKMTEPVALVALEASS